jgi:hypothetical protein
MLRTASAFADSAAEPRCRASPGARRRPGTEPPCLGLVRVADAGAESLEGTDYLPSQPDPMANTSSAALFTEEFLNIMCEPE